MRCRCGAVRTSNTVVHFAGDRPRERACKKVEQVVCFRRMVSLIQNRKPPEHDMKRCILFLLATVVAGCSSGLTLSGYQTRPISMLSAEDCTFVGPASDVRQTRSSAVLDNAIETANARNRASEIGGNAVVFSITASTPRTSSFQMNSYRCPATLMGQ